MENIDQKDQATETVTESRSDAGTENATGPGKKRIPFITQDKEIPPHIDAVLSEAREKERQLSMSGSSSEGTSPGSSAIASMSKTSAQTQSVQSVLNGLTKRDEPASIGSSNSGLDLDFESDKSSVISYYDCGAPPTEDNSKNEVDNRSESGQSS